MYMFHQTHSGSGNDKNHTINENPLNQFHIEKTYLETMFEHIGTNL